MTRRRRSHSLGRWTVFGIVVAIASVMGVTGAVAQGAPDDGATLAMAPDDDEYITGDEDDDETDDDSQESQGGEDTSDDNGEDAYDSGGDEEEKSKKDDEVIEPPERVVFRIGTGGDFQVGIGVLGGARLTLGLNAVLEWNEFRFYGEGGLLYGREVGANPNISYLPNSGYWIGAGVGYKLTLIPPNIFGFYADLGANFQSVSGCVSCTANTRGIGFGPDIEAGLFLLDGSSQVHLGATASLSSLLGLTVGATLRWEYRIAGVNNRNR